MAKLTCYQLTLEVRFREFDENCWLQYEMSFLWEGQPIVDDGLLKRSPAGWANRTYGTFKANEFDCDSLLPLLKRVLDENLEDYWEPAEPDVVLAFYPEREFPFLPSHSTSIFEADHIIRERAEREAAKRAAGGRLPDDLMTVVAFVDGYNWQNCCAYPGSGLALVLRSCRGDVQQFHDELSQEYEAFRHEWRIDERLRDRDGDDEDDDLEDDDE